MTRRFFSGDSVEQAVLQAARHYRIEASEVAYSVVEKRHGFLKIRRRVLIEVDPESPRKEAPVREPKSDRRESKPGAPAPQEKPGMRESRPREPGPTAQAKPPPVAPEPELNRPAREASERTTAPPPEAAGAAAGGIGAAQRKAGGGGRRLVELPDAPRRAVERFPRASGAVAEAAEEALRRIFDLGMLRLQAEVLQGEDRLEIELWGEDQDLLLEDRGRLLLAIQHLLPRLIRGLTGGPAPCRVDCDNFHEIRAERLRDLAQRAAHEVRHRGRPKTLEPMSPDERRIVHLTLSDDPAVVTESHGDGLFKRVVVRPVARRPRGFDPYSR